MVGIATHDTHSSVSLPAGVDAAPEFPARLYERSRQLVVRLPLGSLLPGDLALRVIGGALWVGPARAEGRMIGWRVPLPPEAGSLPRRIRTGAGWIEVAIPWRGRARKAVAA
ncbi:MAG TPA: hypothetical protein VFA86_14305 [Gammaproteobacteria bacterium]|nr:hypothetical protein [Gammaproteobacteria bacterium]